MAATFSRSNQNYVVAVEGLDAVDFSQVPDAIKRVASRAINATARKYRTESARAIREEINFPARYLTGSKAGRLRIAESATQKSLSATIRGRDRATSLARFVKGSRTHGRKAPRVEVGTGTVEKMNRAFLMSLRGGNIGLAVRLAPGERVENKKRMVQVSNGLYLLYGPSVDQVFRSVSEDVSDDAGAYLEQEFLRLTEVFL